jgi:hypothetical protein
MKKNSNFATKIAKRRKLREQGGWEETTRIRRRGGHLKGKKKEKRETFTNQLSKNTKK